MTSHMELGKDTLERKQQLARLKRKGDISFGGYTKAKIYGLLNCISGKRMKLENRVFFKNEQEAVDAGYRPCGNCLPEKYKLWKAAQNQNGSRMI